MTLPTIHFISKNSDLRFPHPFLADEDGLLAIGGDLCPDRIILAYRFGIFPWYSEEQPVLWWAPQERFVLDPTRIHVAKSMRRYINNPIRSEEHTSELQSRGHLVCRLLLEKHKYK